MIKITEKAKDGTDQSSLTQKIQVTLENKEETTFENYPIAIKSKDIKHLIYEIQKSTNIKNNTTHSGGFFDKVKEKAKEVKDAVVGSTKGAAGKAKDTSSGSDATTSDTSSGSETVVTETTTTETTVQPS